MIEIRDKKVSVVGAGKSGIYSSKLLLALGVDVFLSDSGKKENIKGLEELPAEVKTEFGGHSEKVLDADLIVLSPGVPAGIPILKKAFSKKIPVISEIELAYPYLKSPIISITGTNGKTTTTTLIGEIMKASGKKTAVGGNIGEPLVKFARPLLKTEGYDVIVSEISSFQLETIIDFKPHVAVMLNITPDHLDRYAGMAGYIDAKARIFRNQGKDDFAVLNANCANTMSLRPKIRSKILTYSRSNKQKEGVFLKNKNIISNIGGTEKVICNISDIKLLGVHNIENAMASIAASVAMGVGQKTIFDVLRNFSGLEHRIEFVRELNGIKFINDSKGTNVDAVLRAIESFADPVSKSIILILGGRNKDTDFGVLVKPLKESVKKVILIGEAKEQIKGMILRNDSSLGSIMSVVADDMGEAVRIAYSGAVKGDYIVLSPGCASFDMFENYKHRGKVFKEEAGKLK